MSAISGKARRFWKFPAYKKVLFLRAWWLLLSIHTRLKFQDYQTILKRVSRLSSRQAPPSSLAQAFEIRDLVALAASQHVVQMTCLRQALTGCALLNKGGVPALVKLGVKQVDGRIVGHAWLEVEGKTVPILGAAEDDFAELQGRKTSNPKIPTR